MFVTDEMIAAFDMASLETLYPDRRDFVASEGRQRDAIINGLRAALEAAGKCRSCGRALSNNCPSCQHAWEN